MKIHVSGRARAGVLFVVASVLGCWGAFAGEKAVTMLSGENWWGLCSNFGRQMPFNEKSDFKCDLRVSNYSHQSQSVLVSDKGRVLYCDAPVEATIGGGTIKFVSDRGEIILTEDAGKTLAEAFRFASKTYFPPTGEEPELLYFSAPQYNTWVELTYHQNEKDILAYAQSMLDHGLPPGIFMIDDTWQLDYGTWEFDPRRFSDPKGMVDKLHRMGFKVLLWMCPFVSMDSPAYRLLEFGRSPNTCKPLQKGGFVMDPQTGGAAPVRWWNGRSALLDLSHDNACGWLTGVLDGLKREYGVDAFKFDGGGLRDYVGAKASDPSLDAAAQNKLYAGLALKYPGSECRCAFGLAGKPVVMRLHDKEHSWAALQRLVPDMLAAGLTGYPFICPDMIGGGSWESFLPGAPFDPELFIRSAQVHALCPMMQISASPWRVLDAEHQKLFREAVALRQKFAPKFKELAKRAAKDGEPIMRTMEYVFPGCGYANVRDQFLMGDGLLVAPQTVKGAKTRTVEIPQGVWQSDDGSCFTGPTVVTVETPLSRLPHFICLDKLPEAAHERGGVSFDFAKLSEKRMPNGGYPAVGTNLLARPWCGTFKTGGEEVTVTLPHARGGTYRVACRTKVRPNDRNDAKAGAAIMVRFGTANPGFSETPNRGAYLWNGFVRRSDGWFVSTKTHVARPGETHAWLKLHVTRAETDIKDLVFCEEVERPDDSWVGEQLKMRANCIHAYDGVFAVSEGQVGLLGFEFKRRSNKDVYDFERGRFELELPKGIAYVDAQFAAADSVRTETRTDGSVRVTFAPKKGLRFGTWSAFYVANYLMVRATQQAGAGGTGRLTYSYDDGKTRFAVTSKPITFTIVPRISVPQTKRYCNGAMAMGTFAFERPEAIEAGASFLQDVGLTWLLPDGATSYPALAAWRRHGIRRVTPYSWEWCWNGYELGDRHPPEEDQFVPVAPRSEADRQRCKTAMCPLAIVQRTNYVTNSVLPMIRSYLKGVDGLWGNWEPYLYEGNGCACTRCGRAFAAYLGKEWCAISNDWPTCAFKGGAYENEGWRFRSLNHAAVVKLLDEQVRAATGGEKSAGFLPGIQFGNLASSWRKILPERDAQPIDYAGSLKWIQPWGPYVPWLSKKPYFVDRGREVAHNVAARDLRASVDRDYPAGARPQLMAAPQGTVGSYFTQPELFEMNFDAYFFNRFGATCPWPFPVGCDARWWRAFALATARAAKYEDVVWDGRVADAETTVETVPEFAAPAHRVLPQFPDTLDVPRIFSNAYEKDGVRIVAVQNRWEEGEAFFTLRATGLTGRYKLVSENGVLWTKGGGDWVWTADELAKGVFLSVGAARTRVVELVPEEKAGLTTPTSVMTSERLRQIYAERRPALAEIAERDRRGAEGDLSGVTYYE